VPAVLPPRETTIFTHLINVGGPPSWAGHLGETLLSVLGNEPRFLGRLLLIGTISYLGAEYLVDELIFGVPSPFLLRLWDREVQ